MEGLLINFIPRFRAKKDYKKRKSKCGALRHATHVSSWPHSISIHVKKAAGTLTLFIKGTVSPTAVEDATEAGSQGLPAERRANGQNLRNSTSVYTSELLSLLLLTALGVASL